MEYVTKITLQYENKNVFRCLLREVRGDMRFLRMEKMKLQREFFHLRKKRQTFRSCFFTLKRQTKDGAQEGNDKNQEEKMQEQKRNPS